MSSTHHSSTSLKAMRSEYADSFLERCLPVDDDQHLPNGMTYISPWLPGKPQSETLFECRICGVKGTRHILETGETLRDHKRVCRPDTGDLENLKALCQQTTEQLERTPSSQIHLLLSLNSNLIGIYESLTDEHTKLTRLLENSFLEEIITTDHVDATNMEHWAARLGRSNNDELLWFLDSSANMTPRNERQAFGRTCFQSSLLPSDTSPYPGFAPCLMQVSWAPFNSFLNPHNSAGFEHCPWLGLAYTKDAVWAWNQYFDDYEGEGSYKPLVPYLRVPPDGVNPQISQASTNLELFQHGGCHSDVWTVAIPHLSQQLKPLLDDLASITNDCPLPRYQMIIDPNQFVRTRKSDGNKVWVPCEFQVAGDGQAVRLVGGDRAHWLSSSLIDSIATPVMTAALPLLAKLTKPHLLLEGQLLQVVVKAQSITVPQKQEEDDIQEYIGLWHVDGEHEAVAAVVLYYYDVDDALVGGDMEFLDRRPLDVLGTGDTNLRSNFEPGAVKAALRPTNGEPRIPNCHVPISTGTMLVFSNYQMAHRVLRMVNTSNSRAPSRKFVALFVLDPSADRLVPSRSHLAHSYLYERSLMGSYRLLNGTNESTSLPQDVASLVLEFVGIIPSIEQRRWTRNEMLRSQLIPKASLASSRSLVCSTGNGCLTMIGWIDSLLQQHESDHLYNSSEFDDAEERVNALNVAPTQVGRGLSETLSIPSEDLDFEKFHHTLDGLDEKLEGLIHRN